MYYPRNLECRKIEIPMIIRVRTLWLVHSRCGQWTFKVVSAIEEPHPCRISKQTCTMQNSEQMVMTTPTTQPTSPPRLIKASHTCPAVESKKPSLPLGQSRSSHDLLFLTGPICPAQTHLPSSLRAIRPSPFVHDLSQYLRSNLSTEESYLGGLKTSL